ncbi:MAG: hypothetical protein JO323_14615 [Acidobacteriia bacterium]|nr:hypothetical protein [Terriglobia bacterium]
MSTPGLCETLQYECYVDGLRHENALMQLALKKLIAKADEVISAVDGASDQFELEVAALSQATSEAERLLTGAEGTAPRVSPSTRHDLCDALDSALGESGANFVRAGKGIHADEVAALAESLTDILGRFRSCIAQGNGEIEGDREAIAKADTILASLVPMPEL